MALVSKGVALFSLLAGQNYKLFDEYTNHEYDLLHHPERVEQPGLASLVAGWFWHRNKLNELADRDQLMKITKKINGGYNGLEDRGEHLTRAKAALITS